ncbi:MAG: electron transport complex subunit RsxB [Gammaproteobacteria bacterium]|nr:electron transport complex subunit RsxB [Gammaproteobacteria bacterium]MBT8104241.1 electron transport complex subunit RsxB [Gammaproteobacteria bacterium]NNF49080.1 electron transport complex subunit RsxB [Woeseiaceae bacterium]NNK24256.1 electron transport complex subunit RsxB [Woeseiaceae bacterium]NNL63857.1 electron transport complex subunit RsxB [Woeseiaceae bacterium]
MWIAVVTITIVALAAGIALGVAHRRLPPTEGDVVEQVNDLLPQTQCAQCGYPGCRPYAAAVVEGTADINLCPPGGDATIRRLAHLLGREALPLAEFAAPAVAVIDESACIGCFHCRNACPVDAIVGAHQYMHTVIESECTGCELCLAPCPVDCITMRPLP